MGTKWFSPATRYSPIFTSTRIGAGPVLSDAMQRLIWFLSPSLIMHWGIGLNTETDESRLPRVSRLGGYGLPFIRRVFDEVEFDSREGHSTVRLTKRIIPAGDSAE